MSPPRSCTILRKPFICIARWFGWSSSNRSCSKLGNSRLSSTVSRLKTAPMFASDMPTVTSGCDIAALMAAIAWARWWMIVSIEPLPTMYRCNAAVQSKLCMKPGLLIAVPNQSDLISVDRCLMSTAMIPGAISETTAKHKSALIQPELTTNQSKHFREIVTATQHLLEAVMVFTCTAVS